MLESFVALNNRVLDRFPSEERRRIGVHTCPGGDRDATHSADVDYAGLLPVLFRLRAGRFYVQLASEKDPERVLEMIGRYLPPDQTIFVGVIDPIDPAVESPGQVRDARISEQKNAAVRPETPPREKRRTPPTAARLSDLACQLPNHWLGGSELPQSPHAASNSFLVARRLGTGISP